MRGPQVLVQSHNKGQFWHFRYRATIEAALFGDNRTLLLLPW